MRLYPKKLRNVEDLEREKKLLQKECKRMEEEDLLSLEGLLGKKNTENSGGGGIASVLNFLPVDNPIVGTIIKLVQQRLSKKENKPEVDYSDPGCVEAKKPGKSKLKAVAFEFIGGYLKWKAIELSYKGIRHLVKVRKEKREESER